ncbi:SRPBCC domain-containing protein [Echinicola soli]|uniref:SRPBCC domain-containing protein n=1 Tax=Echinicola soli TaxID=2591634 RepID=A0A514CIV0_9BACT|nr:SRPBCC domain-containing protein [Echinicola soli]QDH79745.1 SRPBCC domain-containing protein [Echinicola soli]
MKTSIYTIKIKARPEKIWDILWDDINYQTWTAVFAEESKVETDWQEGSKVLFLDNNGQGMVSRIAKNIPFQFMSIEHLGFYDNGKEDLESENVKGWAGAKENYTLTPLGQSTVLLVEMDIEDSLKEHFDKIWPEALKKIKELSET